MADFEFKLPDLGEGVTEGEVVSWHVNVGDRVAEDQLMVEVMTDKATVTIGAPRTGRVAELRAEVGHKIQVGSVLLVLKSGNGETSSKAPASDAQTPPASASAVGDIKESLPGASYFTAPRASELASPGPQHPGGSRPSIVRSPPPTASRAPAARPSTAPVANTGATAGVKPLATPAVRKLARTLGIELAQVPASGPEGQVTRVDIEQFAKTSAQTVTGVPSPAVAPPTGPSVRARPLNAGGEQRIPFVGMRRKIAERMSASKNTAAHFTFVEECEADALMAMRRRLKPDAQAQGVNLTFLPFVIKAVVAALRKNPMLNSTLDVERNEIVVPETCNIGVAAATGQGLVVPVVHHAEQLSLLEIAAEVDRLGNAARDGKLSLADLSGSTFTVTSLGKQAGLMAVPIINHPNVGILGIHRIKERPVVRDGQIVIGNVMLLSLSLDHRLIDGHEGAAFAYDVIHYLEDPARLLLAP